LPTAAELAGVKPPSIIDGTSVLQTLLGEKQNLGDRFLYWEFPRRGLPQAVRWRNWKAVRSSPDQKLELYDLSKDISEAQNVASQQPALVAKIENRPYRIAQLADLSGATM
jgi:arylsulfatase A